MHASERLEDHHEATTAATKEFKVNLHKAMIADDALVCAIRRDLGIEQAGTKQNATDLPSPRARDRDRLTHGD